MDVHTLISELKARLLKLEQEMMELVAKQQFQEPEPEKPEKPAKKGHD